VNTITGPGTCLCITKGAAIASGRNIWVPDGYLIALDANTGALLWNRQIMDSTNGSSQRPLPWCGTTSCSWVRPEPTWVLGAMMAFRASEETMELLHDGR
jgi:PQQ enzyme repeat